MILLVISSGCFSQIEGNVIDTSGKAIPGALIIAIDSVKNTADTVKSDKSGYFAYKILKRGNYKIVVIAAGFEKNIQENFMVTNETPDNKATSSDISNATWLDIKLRRPKLSQ
ncbi:MAG TPA: carboxypeptidase-like regulatory domain-containing protein [Chitinophagaceae bacterium]|nr:carboxypeptidase-like regulatory domain-containing protein [Chitinophagaceae bacterium]